MIERITGAENRAHMPVESASPGARTKRSIEDEERRSSAERERKDTARISPEARAMLEAEREAEERSRPDESGD